MVESSSSKREFFCYKNLTFRWWSCSVASTARSQGVAWFSFALGSGVGGFWFSSNFRGPNMGMMKFDETNILMKYKTRYPTGGLESPIIFNDNIYNKYTAYYISLDLFFFRSFRMNNLLDDVGTLMRDLNIHGWVEARRKFSMDDWVFIKGFLKIGWLKDRYQTNWLYISNMV